MKASIRLVIGAVAIAGLALTVLASCRSVITARQHPNMPITYPAGWSLLQLTAPADATPYPPRSGNGGTEDLTGTIDFGDSMQYSVGFQTDESWEQVRKKVQESLGTTFTVKTESASIKLIIFVSADQDKEVTLMNPYYSDVSSKTPFYELWIYDRK